MRRVVGMCVVMVAGSLLAGALPQSSGSVTGSAAGSTSNSTAKPAATDWQSEHTRQLLEDFPWLARFRAMDAALPPPSANLPRVVFMGDSITENWQHDGVPFVPQMPEHPWEKINRGISGQTTPQLLLRFRQDVIDLKPSVVVLMAGTNDIAGNTGVMTLKDTENNLASMADLARAHHLRMVLCSVLPSVDFPWHRGLQPMQKIRTLNAWIESYAARHQLVYVDFWTAMADADGGLPANLSKDGVHPNDAGYAIMNPLVDAGIQKALAQPAP